VKYFEYESDPIGIFKKVDTEILLLILSVSTMLYFNRAIKSVDAHEDTDSKPKGLASPPKANLLKLRLMVEDKGRLASSRSSYTIL
jgi:hypothetical protein